jgi:hypothetical protein
MSDEVQKKDKKPIYKRTWFIVVVAGLAIVGLVSNATGRGDSEGTGPETSSDNEIAPDIEWPSLNDIAGGSAEDLTFPNACVALEENLSNSEIYADSADKLVELNAIEGAHEAFDFVEENSWVSSVAGQSPLSVLDDVVANELKSLLSSSYVENASLVLNKNIPLYNIMKTQLKPLVQANCDPDGVYDELAAFSLSAKNTLTLADSVPWYPAEFNAYPGDPTVAYRWADRGCSYSSGTCWTMDLITKAGADYVYVEISIEDSSGSYVDYSNDTARNLRAGQIAKLEFVSFNSGARTGRISEITVQ